MATVETRVFSGVLLVVGMLMLQGCASRGPAFSNALDVPVEMIVRHADGEIWNIPFEPGQGSLVILDHTGDPRNVPESSPKVVLIEEIVIKEDGRILHQFNAEAVRFLIEKQDTFWQTWCIDREKVSLNSPHVIPYVPNEWCSERSHWLWTCQNGRFSKEETFLSSLGFP